MTNQLNYGYFVSVESGFNESVERVKSLLKDEGFGVLCEIDVAKTLKEKTGADFRPYLILGACNPELAHRALTQESQLGLLLPCNVVVQSENGRTTVSAVDASKMLGIVGNSNLSEIAREADSRLRRVIEGMGR